MMKSVCRSAVLAMAAMGLAACNGANEDVVDDVDVSATTDTGDANGGVSNGGDAAAFDTSLYGVGRGMAELGDLKGGDLRNDGLSITTGSGVKSRTIVLRERHDLEPGQTFTVRAEFDIETLDTEDTPSPAVFAYFYDADDKAISGATGYRPMFVKKAGTKVGTSKLKVTYCTMDDCGGGRFAKPLDPPANAAYVRFGVSPLHPGRSGNAALLRHIEVTRS